MNSSNLIQLMIKKYKGQLMSFVFLGLITKLLLLFPVFTFSYIIDEVIPSGSIHNLLFIGLLYLLVTCLQGFLSIFQQKKLARIMTLIVVELFEKFYIRIINSKHSSLSRLTAGQIVQRFGELEAANSNIIKPILTTFLELPFLIIALTLAFSLSSKIAILVVIFVVIITFLQIIAQPYTRKFFLSQLEQKSLNDNHLIETIANVESIKTSTSEGFFTKLWAEGIIQSCKRGIVSSDFSGIVQTSSTTLNEIMKLSVITIGVYSVFTNDITLGQFISFYFLLSHIQAPTTALVSNISSLTQYKALTEKLDDILLMEPDFQEGYPIRKTNRDNHVNYEINIVDLKLILTEKFSINYGNIKFSDRKINLLLGASGSGKSSLMNIIFGLNIGQYIGRIDFAGKDIRNLPTENLRTLISYVPQKDTLFSLNTTDNVLLSQKIKKEDIEGLISNIENSNRITDILATPIIKLSGGELKFINILRGIITTRPIILLDEPTNNLDSMLKGILKDILEQLKPYHCIVIASHDPYIHAIADKIIKI